MSVNVGYRRAEHPKSVLYLEGLPLFTRGQVSIPDHPALIRELRLLERRVSRVGRDTVDHPSAGSDDHANVLIGALSVLADRGAIDMEFLARALIGVPLLPAAASASRSHDPLPWRRGNAAQAATSEIDDGGLLDLYNKLSLPPGYTCNTCGRAIAPFAPRVSDGEFYWCSPGCHLAQGKRVAA
jgi:hypothetical protein